MPASAEALALAEQFRRRQVQLRARFVREFVLIWRATLDSARLGLTSPTWLELSTALIRRWRPVFQRLAAQYYARASALDTGAAPIIAGAAVTGAGLVTPPIAAARVVTSLLRTGLGTLQDARRRGLPLAQADALAMVTAAEDAARLALDAGRDQVQELVEQDRRALGWMRVTDGDPCAFCAMLASRGAVYKSREAAGFELDPVRGAINRYHPNCGCQVVPVFTREPLLPETTQRLREQWETAQREAREAGELRRGTSNDALNAFRRHLATTGGGQ